MNRSESTQQAIELEERHGAMNYHPLPVVLSRGEGAQLWDIEGKRYLDFLAAYSAVNQGHCHPKIIAALTEQASRLTLTSRAFHSDLLGSYEKFMTGLFGYERLLPMNTGVEAVETAVKLARKWAYTEKGLAADRAKIVVCSDNFHGRTLLAVSASTSPDSREGFGPYLPGFVKVPFGDIGALGEALLDPECIAFLVEPIQGEAGVKLPPPGYLREAFEVCREREVLFMADEVQTGIGRTGKMLACDHEDVRPDVLILGKALSGGVLPVSAVLADNEVMLSIRPGEHGSTFGGNPLACAVAMAALEVVREEKLAERAERLGERFRSELSRMRSGAIREVRGRGLMNAIEIDASAGKTAWEICLELLREGVLAKPTRQDTIRFTPPLVIRDNELEEGLRAIRKVLEANG